MPERSKLVKMRIENIGCIGPEGLEIKLNNIIVLVGENNTGKSTILRAYELAVGDENFTKEDFCKNSSEEDIPRVEIWVHIPEGVPNIAEKWKIKDNDLLLVKSKWEWDKNLFKIRKTWDPDSNEYSDDGVASGLDPVFNSRLPKPYRIGTLDDPEKEHSKLLGIILQPINDKLLLKDEASELSYTINQITTIANKPINEEKEKIMLVKDDLKYSHQQIFPNLSLDFKIGLGKIDLDLSKILKENSKIRFFEWENEIDWNKQGTGSQKALFWSILQIRSQLQENLDITSQINKRINDIEKSIVKLGKDAESAKKPETKDKKNESIQNLIKEKEDLEKIEVSKLIEEKFNELTLPGYMLLIDEPEVALHPNAIRAASKHLYNLANDPSWQVMVTTHSPLFVDPLQDHTTIIRLNRDIVNPSTRTYSTDTITFSKEEKENLKLINRFDLSIAEMFFGQYPILVEGDTEFTAFDTIMNKYPDLYPQSKRPILIRARGKFIIKLLIKMLVHFGVSFSILHDIDSPKDKAGRTNGAWTENINIYSEILKGRKNNLKIIHRVSIPNIENAILPIETDDDGYIIHTPSKEKPWKMYQKINENNEILQKIKNVLDDLLSSVAIEEPFKGAFNDKLMEEVNNFIKIYSIKDPRFKL